MKSLARPIGEQEVKMPLSKERMRKRKRLDRLVGKVRFDKAVAKPTVKPELDAEGEPIPEAW